MYNEDSKGLTYSAGFFILIAFFFAGTIAGLLVSMPIWMFMTGQSPLNMAKDMLNPNYVNGIRMVQVVSTFFGFFVPAYATAFLLNRKPTKLLGFKTHFNLKQFLVMLLIMVVAIFFAGALSEINQRIPLSKSLAEYFKHLEDMYSDQVQATANIKTVKDYILSLIIIGLLPAIFEETFFRGGLQNFLVRSTKAPWVSILIVSILFSLAHFSYYGFLWRLALGVILGLIYQYTGSIWLSVLGHFFNNGLGVTEMYILARQGKSFKDNMDETYPIWWGVIALVILIALFYYLKLFSKELQKKYAVSDKLTV
ncbi:MAG: CPBP family intramembrane metalloprotease domain-containing protein [Bacteroidetes bacterium]|nr:MAG: CPBP family intramembrane metalloprotease domain-containing protein [Bacteroidota bacterium]